LAFSSGSQAGAATSTLGARWPRNLRSAFDCLQGQKRNFLDQLSGWTEEEKRWTDSPASWSAVCVLDHLVKVESAALLHLKSGILGANKVTIREKIAAHMVFVAMKLPTRIKVPASAQVVLPSQSPQEDEIVQLWHALRSDMEALICGLCPGQLSRGVFHHPVSGSMTILNAVRFLCSHLTHHRYQLSRIRAAVKRINFQG
jgi:hypothetical protein